MNIILLSLDIILFDAKTIVIAPKNDDIFYYTLGTIQALWPSKIIKINYAL